MIIKTLVLILLFLFLNACTSSRLNFNHKNITIVNNANKEQTFCTQLIYKDYVKLSNMKIEYSILELSNSGVVLVLEEIQPNSGYVFDNGLSNIVSIGFEKYSFRKIASQGNMSSYVLKDKTDDTKILYLYIFNRNKKHLKLMYTRDKTFFDTTGNFLYKDAQKNNVTLNNHTNLTQHKDLKKYIQTNWSEKNLILDGLLKKSPAFPRIVQ